MNRKEFIVCLPMMLAGCAGTKYLSAPIEGDSLVIPLASFTDKKFVVVENDRLQYPVYVRKISDGEYKAILMKCTHQGTELQVFGDMFHCPGHGSEFTNNGAVQNGPADAPLRSFRVDVFGDTVQVKLS